MQLIQKDTSASVRDAAVTLLVTFKRRLPTSEIVHEAVQALPKYRIQEINQRATEVVEIQNKQLH